MKINLIEIFKACCYRGWQLVQEIDRINSHLIIYKKNLKKWSACALKIFNGENELAIFSVGSGSGGLSLINGGKLFALPNDYVWHIKVSNYAIH